MKNKALALGAAVLMSAGIAFSFANTSNEVCCVSEQACTEAQTSEVCCDLPCPIEDCPIPCCKK